jgi:hypothetical protein
MIEWPEATDTDKALKLFKKTSLAAELEEDAQKWTFLAFARSAEAPARMVLRSDAGTTRTFALEQTGFWRESVST